MNKVSKYFKNFWARRRWVIIAFLALALILGAGWAASPQQFKWKVSYSFRTMWRSLTENWGDKWDRIMQMLGFDDTPAGARVAVACSECDVCAAAISRYFHKYDSRDVKSIMGKNYLNPVLIDIRSIEDYEKGSIPGALSIPFDELKSGIWHLERSKTIIIVGYANDDYKKIGDLVVDKWKFYNVGYLVGGFPAWDGEVEVTK